MDDMDIDEIVEVPDTPDRFSKQGINGRSGVKVENHCSSYPFNGQPKLSEEGTRDQPMLIDSGSRGRPMHPPKRTNSPSNSRRPNSFAVFPASNSSSSRNVLFRKGVAEKNPKHPSHDSMHNQQSMRPPKSSSFSDNDGFPDSTEGNLNRPVIGNASMSGNNQGDFRKRSGLNNGTSSHGLQNLSIGSSIACKEGVDFVGNDNKKPGNTGFLSIDPVGSPKVNRQKRLVRNGCISPNNIAKVKQLAEKEINGSVAVAHNDVSVGSSAPPISTDIRELVAEESDSHTKKGKGVISVPCSSKGPDFHHKNLHSRSSVSFSEKADESGSGGWRSTRNRTREFINITSPDQEGYLNMERGPTRSQTQHHENRLERRGKGISIASGDDYSKDPSFISSENVRPLREPLYPRARLGRPNVPRSADFLIKRQKQGSNSTTRGECSTPVDDPEVVFLSSSNSNSNNVGSNLQQIIEVDELSPQLRRNAHEEDAKTRQLEADELLALELQEQFYNEGPLPREVDEQIALSLRDQEGSSRGVPRAVRPVSHARSTPNLHRPSPSAPRRATTRASALGRMTRMRNHRFPGQPRTLLASRGRTSMFPPDMDIEMRMHILGALEDLNDMGVGTSIFQADRDFNEDDYEMLLALDENNHQHGGASIHRINGLPQSTVQSDNFEEACAICLDTPTVGDTIRHLPCLHKFHKDCIDPWLTRRPSCPVCKSSIT